MSDEAAALRERLAALRVRVADLVRRRSEGDLSAADPLRGLYLTADDARHLLARQPLPAARPGDPYGGIWDQSGGRLGTLVRRFDLTALDVHLLVAAMAPDIDRTFEQLYGYLNDDVSRRRATVALTLDLVGLAPHDACARARFHPSAPLVRTGLLAVEDAERPLPGRALRVPERVIAHLLGDDSLDGELPSGAVEVMPVPGDRPVPGSFETGLAMLLPAGSPGAVVHLRQRRTAPGVPPAVAALHAAGLPVLRFDPSGLDDPAPTVQALLREARLRGAGVVIGPLPERPLALARVLEGATVPVVLVGAQSWDPQWSRRLAPLCLDAPPGEATGVELWHGELGEAADGIDVAEAVSAYRLGPDRVRGAARAARALATLDGVRLTAGHLRRGARQQSATLLDRHARRVEPAVGWADLVLPPEPESLLRELALRARQRDRVLGGWRMLVGGGRGRGVVALFAGESGTGKTMAAELLAGDLGVDLYVVDLSAVVDKYVGETEKNLERIFTEVAQTDAVLLFDEADALFGKRSEVRDAHDRYANLESAYLLQRLESFDGVAVLTTNLRANIDDAFTRRLDLVIDFPFPDAAQRATLWRRSLAGAPHAADLDGSLDALAARFELGGGAIRAAAVTAAYLAAGRDGQVSAADAEAGARREYVKFGRLVIDDCDATF